MAYPVTQSPQQSPQSYENAQLRVAGTRGKEIRYKVGLAALAVLAVLAGGALIASSYFVGRALMPHMTHFLDNKSVPGLIRFVGGVVMLSPAMILGGGGFLLAVAGGCCSIHQAVALDLKKSKVEKILRDDQFLTPADKAKFIHHYNHYVDPRGYFDGLIVPLLNDVKIEEIGPNLNLEQLVTDFIGRNESYKSELLNKFAQSESNQDPELKEFIRRECMPSVRNVDVSQVDDYFGVYGESFVGLMPNLGGLTIDLTKHAYNVASQSLGSISVANYNHISQIIEIMDKCPNLIYLTLHVPEGMSLQNIVNAIQEIIAKDGTRMQKRLSNIELHLHQHPNVTPALLQANLPAEVARAGLQPRVYQNVLSLHR